MSIKVKALIEELQKLDPELYVALSSDAEGNTYNFLEGINTNCRYHDGEVYLAALTDDLIDNGYSEEDVSEEGIECVVFYPSHDSTILEAVLAKSKRTEEK